HKDATIGGGDAWITIEFFKQYGEDGLDILGETYSQTITSYLNSFDMENLRAGHPKTVQQWALLGDPTLKIGGYN
ncbi:MAG: peptidase C25, partial [Thermoplasmatales archaeon]|nr:peptidase C25 [Thermoplasmatales archaeon]